MLAFATFVFYAAFVFYQVFNLLNVRNLTGSVVTRETLASRRAFVAAGAVLVLPVAVVRLEVSQATIDPQPTPPEVRTCWRSCRGTGGP